MGRKTPLAGAAAERHLAEHWATAGHQQPRARAEDHVGGDGSDLLALLGADLPASAAAGSSARFPFIGPLGTFRDLDGAGDAVADGGYFANLGASALLELLDALDSVARQNARRVRFVVLQLVNNPNAGSGDAPIMARETPWSLLPRGLTGPATVLLRTREARGVERVRGAGPARRRIGRRLRSGAAEPLADRPDRPARLVALGRGARGH